MLQKGVRNLQQHAGAVAGILLATAGPAVIQILENGQRLLDDLAGFFALDIDDEADAAGIVFESGII